MLILYVVCIDAISIHMPEKLYLDKHMHSKLKDKILHLNDSYLQNIKKPK